MSDGIINHQFDSIFNGLDDSQKNTQALQEIKDNLVAGFGNLFNSGAFEGAAGQQLLAIQQQIGQRIDDCGTHLSTLGSRAVDQQHETQSLDIQGMHAMGG